MATVDIDFEGTGGNGSTSQAGTGIQGVGGGTHEGAAATKEDVTDLTGDGVSDINKQAKQTDTTSVDNDITSTTTVDNQTATEEHKDDTISSTGELEVGMQVEYENNVYTVSNNGDLVDKDGKVFKAAADVKNWMDSLEQEEDNNLSIEAIQEALGTEITDEEGKAIEYSNDAAGVKAYVEAVVALKSKDLQEGAINKLYSDNPLLKQFQDYVTVTGSPVGFGELPDRSGIVIDKDNLTQQEAVVKMAAKEFGNKSLNDNYIKYLKDTGGLYEEAVNQLKALQEKDKAVRQDIQLKAEAARNKEIEELNAYWNKVNDVIKSRLIAGYKLPESFVKEVNGQKQTLTPNDFYNYLSRQTEVDADGNRITAYQRDLANETDDDYLNRELINAWLMYTDGTYKDLIDMAVKEEQVRVLKLKSKQRSANKTVKLIKANNGKVDSSDIILS